MTKQELNNLNFYEAIDKLEQENDCITTIDELKSFAIYNINNDNLFIAIHILQAIQDEAEYYNYDYNMGTLETPTPITSLEDLEDFCK